MTKKIFAIQAVLALLGSVSVNAANLRQNRILVQESIRHAEFFQNNYRRPDYFQLRQAEDKLTFVQSDIRDLRDSREKQNLERSLDEALRALLDRRLPDDLKARAVIQNGNMALVSIDALDRGDGGWGGENRTRRELDSALFELSKIDRSVRDRRFEEADRIVRSVISRLQAYVRSDRDIDDAVRELDVLSRILCDRYANPRVIEDQAARSVRIANDLVLRSRTYRDGGRDGYDDNRGELGRTGYLGQYSTTDVIRVGRNEGRFVALNVKAFEADIRLDSIEVVYGNGRREIFRGGFLRQGETLRLDLRGLDRAILEIVVTGQSMGRGGPRQRDGFLVVSGATR